MATLRPWRWGVASLTPHHQDTSGPAPPVAGGRGPLARGVGSAAHVGYPHFLPDWQEMLPRRSFPGRAREERIPLSPYTTRVPSWLHIGPCKGPALPAPGVHPVRRLLPRTRPLHGRVRSSVLSGALGSRPSFALGREASPANSR